MKTKNQDIPAQVAALREQITALQHEGKTLMEQGRSRAEVQDYMRREVEEWRTGAERSLRQHAREIAHGDHPRMLTAHTIVQSSTGVCDIPIGPALALVLGADVVAAALAKYTDHVPEGVSRAESARRLTEIAMELDRLEAQEEHLIEHAELAGETIDRRADARPEIVLGRKDEVEIRPHPYLYQSQSSHYERHRRTVVPAQLSSARQ